MGKRQPDVKELSPRRRTDGRILAPDVSPIALVHRQPRNRHDHSDPTGATPSGFSESCRNRHPYRDGSEEPTSSMRTYSRGLVNWRSTCIRNTSYACAAELANVIIEGAATGCRRGSAPGCAWMGGQIVAALHRAVTSQQRSRRSRPRCAHGSWASPPSQPAWTTHTCWPAHWIQRQAPIVTKRTPCDGTTELGAKEERTRRFTARSIASYGGMVKKRKKRERNARNAASREAAKASGATCGIIAVATFTLVTLTLTALTLAAFKFV